MTVKTQPSVLSHKRSVVSIPSAPQTLPVSAAEPSASPLHPLQPVGRSFQHHVHTAGPLQWPQSPDHQIPVLCPQGTKKLKNKLSSYHFIFSSVNSLSVHHQSRSAAVGFTLSNRLQFSVFFISINQVPSWQPFPSLLTARPRYLFAIIWVIYSHMGVALQATRSTENYLWK